MGCPPMDQIIEETANREIKASGERRDSVHGPVARYYLTLKYIRPYISELRNMIDDNKSSFDHPDLWRSEDLKNQTR